MQLFVDIDLRKSIVSPGDRSAAATIVCSSQDTLELDVYFCQAGAIIDVGAGAALRFGIFASSALTVALALIPAIFPTWSSVTAYTAGQVVSLSGVNYVCILSNTNQTPPNATYWLVIPGLTWARQGPDANGNYFWRGLLYCNTTQMAAAIGVLTTLPCQSEFRYQLSDGEVVHSIYLAFSVFPALLTEQSTYTIIIPPPGYPDASTIELLAHKDQPSGYVGLSAGSKMPAAEVPIDGTTIVVASSQLHVPIDNSTLQIVGGQLKVAGGVGAPILGAIVKTTLTVPTWTVGGTFKVYLTNVSGPIWVGGGDIAIFTSSDGLVNYGNMEVDSQSSDGGGQFILLRENLNYAIALVAGTVVPAGSLVFFGIGLQTTQTSVGAPLVSYEQTTPDNFYPSVKGIKTTDLSVKVIDDNLDLDFRVSTPAFAGFIPSPAAQAYTVDLAAATTYKLVKVYLKVSTGTLTAALNKNGTGISGATAISVSSTRSSTVISQVVAVDDLIELVLSSLSGTPLNFAWSVRTQPN